MYMHVCSFTPLCVFTFACVCVLPLCMFVCACSAQAYKKVSKIRLEYVKENQWQEFEIKQEKFWMMKSRKIQ